MKDLVVVITEMPRKNEIQSEEQTVSSPLRRSSRAAAASSGPAAVKTRRSSLLAQENAEENIESKPATRTRRGNLFV